MLTKNKNMYLSTRTTYVARIDSLLRVSGRDNKYRLFITGNQVKAKNRLNIEDDCILTLTPSYNQKHRSDYLTDSWQTNPKRNHKWLLSRHKESMDKIKHTHITRANYYSFD